MMWKRLLTFIFIFSSLFTTHAQSASILEGVATVQSEEFPQSGLFAKSGRFPVGSIISVYNPQTEKQVDVRVIEQLENSSEFIVVSPEAAESIGMGSVNVVRVAQSGTSFSSGIALDGRETALHQDPDINPTANIGRRGSPVPSITNALPTPSSPAVPYPVDQTTPIQNTREPQVAEQPQAVLRRNSDTGMTASSLPYDDDDDPDLSIPPTVDVSPLYKKHEEQTPQKTTSTQTTPTQRRPWLTQEIQEQEAAQAPQVDIIPRPDIQVIPNRATSPNQWQNQGTQQSPYAAKTFEKNRFSANNVPPQQPSTSSSFAQAPTSLSKERFPEDQAMQESTIVLPPAVSIIPGTPLETSPRQPERSIDGSVAEASDPEVSIVGPPTGDQQEASTPQELLAEGIEPALGQEIEKSPEEEAITPENTEISTDTSEPTIAQEQTTEAPTVGVTDAEFSDTELGNAMPVIWELYGADIGPTPEVEFSEFDDLPIVESSDIDSEQLSLEDFEALAVTDDILSIAGPSNGPLELESPVYIAPSGVLALPSTLTPQVNGNGISSRTDGAETAQITEDPGLAVPELDTSLLVSPIEVDFLNEGLIVEIPTTEEINDISFEPAEPIVLDAGELASLQAEEGVSTPSGDDDIAVSPVPSVTPEAALEPLENADVFDASALTSTISIPEDGFETEELPIAAVFDDHLTTEAVLSDADLLEERAISSLLNVPSSTDEELLADATLDEPVPIAVSGVLDSESMLDEAVLPTYGEASPVADMGLNDPTLIEDFQENVAELEGSQQEEAPIAEGETPRDGEEAPGLGEAEGEEAPIAEGETPRDGEEAPGLGEAEGEEAPIAEGETPRDGEEAPGLGEAEGEEAPIAEGETPRDGEAPRLGEAEGEEAPIAEGETPRDGEAPRLGEAESEEAPIAEGETPRDGEAPGLGEAESEEAPIAEGETPRDGEAPGLGEAEGEEAPIAEGGEVRDSASPDLGTVEQDTFPPLASLLGVTPEMLRNLRLLPDRIFIPGPPADAAFIPDARKIRHDLYYVQVATVSKISFIENILKQLVNYSTFVIPTLDSKLYRVFVGPLSKDERGVMLYKIRELGFKDAFFKTGTVIWSDFTP